MNPEQQNPTDPQQPNQNNVPQQPQAPAAQAPAAPQYQAQQPQPTYLQQPYAVPASPASGKSKLPWIIAGAALLVILLGATIFALVLIHNSPKTGYTYETDNNTKPVNATPPKNACDLVTPDEAAKIFGQPFHGDSTNDTTGKPKQDSYASSSSCEYTSDQDLTKGVIVVGIEAHNPGTGHAGFVAQEYQQDKQSYMKDQGSKAISGVGDDAFWDGTSKTLFVKKGDSYYTFVISGGASDDQDIANAESLAKAALSKL